MPKKKSDQFSRFYVCWIQTSELTNKQTDEANLHWDIDFLVLIVCLKICVNYFQIFSKRVERDLEKFFSDLKGVFAKNERGNRLMAKNKRFWSLLLLLFYNNILLAQDFRTFLENMKMSSSLSKILETGINVF